MKIKFKEVELHNFMSFLDATIDLGTYGFTSIKGQNNYIIDNADSNGSGKSAIWESVVWALTGDTIRGFSDVCRHGCEDGCYVRLLLSIDSHEYELIRSKNHTKYKTDLKIYIDGEDKSGKGIRDSEKLLSQYLPDLTSTLLGSVIVLGQGLPQRFSNNTPSGRKKLLEELSQSDFMIEDLKERVAHRNAELVNQKQKNGTELIECSTKHALFKSNLVSTTEKLKSLSDISVSEDLLKLTEQMKLKCDEEIENHTEHIYELKVIINDLTDSNKLRNENLIKALDEVSALHKDELNVLSEKINDLNVKSKLLQHKITELDSIVDVCPTCGQKLPDVSKVDTTELKNELKGLKKDLEVQTEFKKSLESEIEKNKTEIRNDALQQIEETNEAIKLKTAELEEYEKDLKGLTNKRNDWERDLLKYKNEIDNFYSKKEELESEIENLNGLIETLDSKILYYNNILSDVEDRIGIMSNFSTVLSRDFRGILLSSVIAYINERAKNYAKAIFDTDLLEFVLDGNNLNILYNGKEYESLSGGEKQKVDVIIQLSIRDMLCQHLDFSCNVLVLDEITDNLDNIGCDKMIQLISSNLSDVESIYIISHRQDLNIPFDRELNVIKNEEGFSSIL